MKYLIIIQSRFTSKRLPGKALKKVKKKEMLLHLIKRLKQKKIFHNKIIVATSNSISDDKIIKFCEKNNIKYFRGPLHNVFKRYLLIIKKFNLDYIIRINGDSPLIDYRIIVRAIKKFKEYKSKNVDMITNTLTRSFPKGQSVEVINSKTIININDYIKKKIDKEHVTKYIYDNANRFMIKNIKYKKKLEKINMSVDNIFDFRNFEKTVLNKKFKYSLTFLQILKFGHHKSSLEKK